MQRPGIMDSSRPAGDGFQPWCAMAVHAGTAGAATAAKTTRERRWSAPAWNSSHEAVLALVCVVVIAFYGWRCTQGVSELGNTSASRAYYNLLVDGFRAGQLNLKVDTPPGLAELPDPWLPSANAPFRKMVLFDDNRLHDTSYYQGKLYLYFSATPALLLFWPYHALTGGYLEHRIAVAVFCSIGFVIAVGLWRAICRRYFSTIPVSILAAAALALGMANSAPVMLARPDVWEVPISCAYALTMTALAALWRSFHDGDHLVRWLAIASLAFALAVSARPSLLPAAHALLLPLIFRWRGRASQKLARTSWFGALAAVAVPMALIGAALVLYNYQRFGDPFEFGQRYQLAQARQDDARHFSGSYLWFNFRLYFLSVASWSSAFPFVANVAVPPLPPGHAGADGPFGILVNTPSTLFAVALPFIWWIGGGGNAAPLRWFAATAGMFFVIIASVLCLFFGTCTRYQLEFNAPLVLLAAIGLAALHQESRGRAPGAANTIALLAAVAALFSAGFSTLKGIQKTSELLSIRGVVLDQKGDLAGALPLFERATRLAPGTAEVWFNAAAACQKLGRIRPAIERYEQCIRVAPGHVTARNNLGVLLRNEKRLREAATVLLAGIALNPNLPTLHFNLARVFQDAGNAAKAAEYFEHAVRLQPDFAEAHYRLALSLRALGRIADARQHHDEARRLQPALPDVRF